MSFYNEDVVVVRDEANESTSVDTAVNLLNLALFLNVLLILSLASAALTVKEIMKKVYKCKC